MKTKILFQPSHKLSNQKFQAESDRPISEEDAKREQERLGYPVMGYSFYRFKTYEHEGKFIAEWLCYGNCE
jgi:hypothetical protein